MFQSNQQIGLYILVKQIGRGGFGEVWLAERRTEILTTQVAIKLPHREQVNLDAIRQEAELWAKASGHANILPIIEANIYNGQIVIVSEYAPDGSLEEKIQSQIPFKQTIETIIGILNGLEFLHSRQIIHRDIKPANILLQGETPRLADFGISRIVKTTALITSIVGTPKYMAPEAFNGKRTVQTDIWSVGVILYQMLCGNVPFRQENPTELMYAIVFNEPEPITQLIPPDLRQIVYRALSKQPENRFQSAREMRDELQRALLNISHPTFAPTEVLQKKPIDNQTIEDNSVFTNKPLTDVPKPIPAPTNLVNKTINQNQLQSNIPTEYNPILPTVPALKPQYQEPPPATVLQATEITNQQTRGFHWGFYFLPLLIDSVVRLVTFNLSFKLVNSLFGTLYDLGDHEYIFTKIIYVELPMEAIIYGIIGLLFGLIFPQAKWKWGVWLNFNFFLVTILGVPQAQFPSMILLVLVTTTTACLTSFLGSLLSPRKSKNISITLEESKNARIERWIFYFIAPIIGIMNLFVSNVITLLVFRETVIFSNWSIFPFLLIDTLIFFLFIFITLGVIGMLLGDSFPSEKWRWGLWLNLFNIIAAWIIRGYFDYFGYSPSQIFGSSETVFFLLAIIIQNSFMFILPCLTSYLGSWLAQRNINRRIELPSI